MPSTDLCWPLSTPRSWSSPNRGMAPSGRRTPCALKRCPRGRAARPPRGASSRRLIAAPVFALVRLLVYATRHVKTGASMPSLTPFLKALIVVSPLVIGGFFLLRAIGAPHLTAGVGGYVEIGVEGDLLIRESSAIGGCPTVPDQRPRALKVYGSLKRAGGRSRAGGRPSSCRGCRCDAWNCRISESVVAPCKWLAH
jgi:hypothetical protein